MAQRPLNVGLIGLGTVGSQVAERLLTAQPQLSRRAGVELCLKRVLVRDLKKHRAIEIAPDLLTVDPADVLEDPAIDVLVEVAGGDEPMRTYLERAIAAGKHVITADTRSILFACRSVRNVLMSGMPPPTAASK